MLTQAIPALHQHLVGGLSEWTELTAFLPNSNPAQFYLYLQMRFGPSLHQAHTGEISRYLIRDSQDQTDLAILITLKADKVEAHLMASEPLITRAEQEQFSGREETIRQLTAKAKSILQQLELAVVTDTQTIRIGEPSRDTQTIEAHNSWRIPAHPLLLSHPHQSHELLEIASETGIDEAAGLLRPYAVQVSQRRRGVKSYDVIINATICRSDKAPDPRHGFLALHSGQLACAIHRLNPWNQDAVWYQIAETIEQSWIPATLIKPEDPLPPAEIPPKGYTQLTFRIRAEIPLPPSDIQIRAGKMGIEIWSISPERQQACQILSRELDPGESPRQIQGERVRRGRR